MNTAESYRDQTYRDQPSLFDVTVVTERVAGDHSGCETSSRPTDNAHDSQGADSSQCMPPDHGTQVA